MGQTDQLALPATLSWAQALLTGSLAQAIAIIAFAGIGYAALSGRMSVRSTMQVVLGAFIVFGAPSIATALRDVGDRPTPSAPAAYAPPPPVLATQGARDAERRQSIDPYAGASIPM